MGAGTSAGDAARSRRGERAAAAKGAAAGSPVTESPAAGSPAVEGPVAASPAVGERTPPELVVGEKAVGDAAGRSDGGSRAARPTAADVDANANANANANADVDADADSDGDDGERDRSGTDEPDRRFSITQDTARPEGGGRAAPGEAPAPARQWPLLSVLGTTALGLLVVGTHPFAEAFRIGTILIGVALIGGAVLRRVLPSVGMLAVRSRFTDMLTYGVLGVVIVLLSLMTQPKPWLEIPFLEDVVHSTVP